jgi:hypothetical protein
LNKTDDFQKQFQCILESSLEQLLLSSLNGLPILIEEIAVYRDVLIAYLRSDLESLEKYISILESNSLKSSFVYYPTISKITKTRYAIRKKNCSLEKIENFTRECISDPYIIGNPILLGEIYFVAALAYESMARHSEAKYYYELAAPLFYSADAHKRSLIANFNSLAATSKLYSNRNYIVDYQILIEKSKLLQVEILVGIGYNNISREYQLMGANNTALRFANQAVHHLNVHYPGSINYFLTLIQRCHLYLETKQWRNAFSDFEEINCSPFLEIKKSAEVLTYFMKEKTIGNHAPEPQADPNPTDFANLTFSWKERLNQYIGSEDIKTLSETEEQLVQLLVEHPLTTHDIIEKLYGNKIDFNSAHTRVRTLLTRLRRKKPGLIVYQNGTYALNELFLLPKNRIDQVRIGQK